MSYNSRVSECLRTTESGVARLTINRPDRRNALDGATIEALRQALRSSVDDTAARVITLTGSGDTVFCAGADLKAALGEEQAPGDFGRAGYRELLLELRRCPKPTVALARGHVMAGGLGILLACDFALGCDDIHVSTPEINVGLFPMMVLALLYRHVGRKKATEMLFLGDRMPAAEARECGIFNALYGRGDFEPASAAYVAQLARKSGAVLRLGKSAILHVEDRLLADELEYLEHELGRVMTTEDSREGVKAFLEKRAAHWRDR